MTTSPGLAAAWPEDLAAAGARAAIVVVCREPGPLEILSRELSKRYGADYQIVVCDPPADLETRTRDLLAAALPVAMIIGKIGAQDRDGIEVLAVIRGHTTAVRVATVRWGNWESVRSVFDGITLGKIDHSSGFGRSPAVPGWEDSRHGRRCSSAIDRLQRRGVLLPSAHRDGGRRAGVRVRGGLGQ